MYVYEPPHSSMRVERSEILGPVSEPELVSRTVTEAILAELTDFL